MLAGHHVLIVILIATLIVTVGIMAISISHLQRTKVGRCYFLLVIVVWVLSTPVRAQQNAYLAADRSHGIELLGTVFTAYNIIASLPAVVDLTAYCPPIAEQAYETCYAFAATYGAASVAYNAAHHFTDTAKMIFSPGFTVRLCTPRHWPGNRHCRHSGNIADAAIAMQRVGAVPKQTYIEECTCAPYRHLLPLAAGYHMSCYNLLDSDTAEPVIVGRIRSALSAGSPVVVSFLDMASFDACWHQPYWKMSVAEEQHLDTCSIFHAACIVGYNDTLKGGAFRLMNSWGTTFGSGGFIDIPYHDLVQLTSIAYAVQPVNTR
jgi:hypothetical protein